MARGRPPGGKRVFGFERLRAFDAALWQHVQKETFPQRTPQLFASDLDAKALSAARRNFAAAGIERWVGVERADVLERAAPAPAGVLV
jgi:putative N6-adenine-specific DNA methylase